MPPVDIDRLNIVIYPHPALRVKAKPIKAITEEVRRVAQRMIQLMHAAPGIGLAAPQIGLNWRLFVACPSSDPQDDRVFVNPLLRDPGREMEDYEEGCLSLPNINGTVRRPKVITVEALDLQGNTFTLTSDALPSRVWQHETDHLDGVLILDRMSELDRLATQGAVRELEKRMPAKGPRKRQEELTTEAPRTQRN